MRFRRVPVQIANAAQQRVLGQIADEVPEGSGGADG